MKAADGPAIVKELLGVELTRTSERWWAGHCPWHEDNDPSFTVYVSRAGYWRVGCWTCGVDMSLVELVCDEKALTPPEAQRWLLTGPEMPETISRASRGRLAGLWMARARAASLRPAFDVLNQLAGARRYTVPMSWATRHWRVGTEQDTAVIPHYGPADALVGVKLRRGPDWTPIAVPGSQFDPLYGAWRDQQHDRVVLCEGEGDCWHASYWLRTDDVDVLGLPSGAAQHTPAEWLEQLAGREVVMVPDGDDAGRRWAERLRLLLPGSRVVPAAEGKDVTSMGEDWLQHEVR